MTTLTLGRTAPAPPWTLPASNESRLQEDREPGAHCLTLSPRSVEVLQTLNEIFNSLGVVGGDAAVR